MIVSIISYIERLVEHVNWSPYNLSVLAKSKKGVCIWFEAWERVNRILRYLTLSFS
jgi:hypothetical protein